MKSCRSYKSVLRCETASPAKRALFNWAMGVGQRVTKDKIFKRRSSPLVAAQFRIADKLVFSKLKAALGGKIQFLNYAAAPASGFSSFVSIAESALTAVPASVVSPSLLFKEVEVEKSTGPFRKVPLLSPPPAP